MSAAPGKLSLTRSMSKLRFVWPLSFSLFRLSVPVVICLLACGLIMPVRLVLAIIRRLPFLTLPRCSLTPLWILSIPLGVTLREGLKAVLLFVVLMIGVIEVYALHQGVNGIALSASLGALGAVGGYVARRSDAKAVKDA